jgi:CBS domain-containing protein/ribosome-associated translation inhibitor RaiA
MSEVPTVEVDDSLSSVKAKMEDEDLRAVAVVNSKNQLKGAVSYRELIRGIQFAPDRTRLERVMHQPPEFGEDHSLVELCDLRIETGRKLLVRTDEHGHLEGGVGDAQFLGALRRLELDESTRRLTPNRLVEVFEQDTVEEARHLMLDNNISRLPVLNENGELTGILRSTDVLAALEPRQQMSSGGTQGGRSGGDVKIAGGGEKQSLGKVTVDQLMSRDPSTSEEHMELSEALDTMESRGQDEIIFVDGSYPESILTLKDAVEHVAEMAATDTVLVSLVGLEMPEEKSAVHSKIAQQLQGSLGRKLEQPEELRVHVKKSEKDGRKHRYELNFRLFSELGQLNVESEEWELMDAVDSGLSELDARVRKEKDKRTDY